MVKDIIFWILKMQYQHVSKSRSIDKKGHAYTYVAQY